MPDPYTPPAGGPPPNDLTVVWGVAGPQGGRPAAVFFPLGYPFPYGPDQLIMEFTFWLDTNALVTVLPIHLLTGDGAIVDRLATRAFFQRHIVCICRLLTDFAAAKPWNHGCELVSV
jgi:hypothetical protein